MDRFNPTDREPVAYQHSTTPDDLQDRIDAFYEAAPRAIVESDEPDDGKWAWFGIPLAFLVALAAWVGIGMLAENLLPR